MLIKTDMLRCFAAVARAGGLGEAAGRLGRTPSAVSMTLKQLETALGAPLFESGRKNRLTALGTFVLGEALRELDHFDRTLAAIEGFARSESGFVRVAAVPSVAAMLLPGVAGAFLRTHPGVRIDIRDMDSAAIVREIERGQVDLGLASGGAAGIHRERLFSDVFGVVCAADHELAQHGGPVPRAALNDCLFIANGLCDAIADKTLKGIIARSHLMVRNMTSLLAMVRAGIGVTVLPRLAVGGGGLVFLALAGPPIRRRIDILRRANVSLSPAALQFEEAVRRAARQRWKD